MDERKQKELGDWGGVEVLLDLCDPTRNVKAALLVPVVWGLRNCVHDNSANKDRLIRANGLETLAQVRFAVAIKDAFISPRIRPEARFS